MDVEKVIAQGALLLVVPLQSYEENRGTETQRSSVGVGLTAITL